MIAVFARTVGAGIAAVPLSVLLFAAIVAWSSLALRIADPPFTTLMVYRAVTARVPVRPLEPVPLERLPSRVPAMFVAVEDQAFYTHRGVDPEAIRDAIRLNRLFGRIVYGGSTITMQLARTLFLNPERTYVRKALEAVAAIVMERVLDKRRILELYLNTIEYGRGVYGIQAAARHHYGKDAARLSKDEARRLAALVASPLRYDVRNFTARRALRERYEFLCRVFP